jgi:hypothetical protein
VSENKKIELLSKKPDFVSFEKPHPSDIFQEPTNIVSSEYWYDRKGLYRRSSHWGTVSKCKWFINANKGKQFYDEPILAFCRWESMKDIISIEEIINVDNGIIFNNLTNKQLNYIEIITSVGIFKIKKVKGNYFCLIDKNGIERDFVKSFGKFSFNFNFDTND